MSWKRGLSETRKERLEGEVKLSRYLKDASWDKEPHIGGLRMNIHEGDGIKTTQNARVCLDLKVCFLIFFSDTITVL